MTCKTLVIALTLAATSTAWTQEPSPGGPRPPRSPTGDKMMENLFPAEMVMHLRQEIGLKDDQAAAIKDAMQKSLTRFTDLQWQQSAEAGKIEVLVKNQPVNETEALAQLDKLLKIESDIKHLHLETLIKVKNVLTPEQQAKLKELRKQMRPPQRPRGGDRQDGAGQPRPDGPRGDGPRPPDDGGPEGDGPPPPPR